MPREHKRPLAKISSGSAMSQTAKVHYLWPRKKKQNIDFLLFHLPRIYTKV